MAPCPNRRRPLPLGWAYTRYGSIPVIISDQLASVGLPFQCLVPWDAFTVTLPEKLYLANISAALDGVVHSFTADQLSRARRVLYALRRDVLWFLNNSRVSENMLIDAARLQTPESNHWEALPCPFPNRWHAGEVPIVYFPTKNYNPPAPPRS